MAKNIQLQNAAGNEDLFPKTKASIVVMDDGTNVEEEFQKTIKSEDYNGGMDADIAPDIVKKVNDLSTQMVDKMNKTDVLGMANLSQEVKEAMTGGSVAVIGKDSVETENIRDNSVTLDKIDFIELSENLFDKNNIKRGYTTDTNGNPVSGYNDQFYYDLKIEPNTNYAIRVSFASSKIVLLDSSKKYIKDSYRNANKDVVITTTEDSKYIRINGYIPTLDNVMVCLNELPSTYVPYKYKLNDLYLIDKNFEDNSINKNKLSEELNEILDTSNSIFGSNIYTVVPILNKLGKNTSINKAWGSGTSTIEFNNVVDDYRHFKIIGSSSASIYQFFISEITNPNKENVYVRLKYEVILKANSVSLVDRGAGNNFDISIGEHVAVYTTRTTGFGSLKFEFNLGADSEIEMIIKELSVTNFNEASYTENEIKSFLIKYGYFENSIKILNQPIASEYLLNNSISSDKLTSELRTQLKESGWKNKVWVSYGDSITAQNHYQTNIAKSLGIVSVNKGIGGSTACGNGDNAGWQDVRINSFPEKVDLITIMFGTNDWSQNKSIGEDDGNTDTYKGALGIIIKKLQNKYPFARIVLLSPPYRTSSQWNEEPRDPFQNGLSIMDFGNAVKDIARKYGLPFVDTYGEMGVNIYNFKNFLLEEGWPVHLNSDGGKRLAEVLLNTLNKIEPIE